MLREAGHTGAEIERMTRRQLLLHFCAAQKLRAQRRAEFVVDASHAAAGGKEATRHLRELIAQAGLGA